MKFTQSKYPFLNTVTLAITLFVNYWVNSGFYSGETVGAVSRQYDTLFTPATYAFSIWGVIYLGLIVFVAYQWHLAKSGKGIETILLTGAWLAVANILNACWVVAWVNHLPGLSVLIMLGILFSLLTLAIRLNLECWDASVQTIAFVWWPVTIYFGWIVLATVANFSAYFVSLGWNGTPLTEELWAVIMIVLATVIYIFLISSRSMREAAAIGIWGLLGIAVKQWSVHNLVAYSAMGMSLVLFIVAAIHGYKNRKANPFFRYFNK